MVVGFSDDQDDGDLSWVMRLEDDGDRDTTFAPASPDPGIVEGTYESAWNAVVLQGTRILVAGWMDKPPPFSDDYAVVGRFTEAGAPDATFGDPSTPGRREFDPGSPNVPRLHDLALDSEGRILVAGADGPGGSVDTSVLAGRLTENGALDPTWNAAGSMPGVTIVPVGDGTESIATAIAARPRGGALVAGYAEDGGAFRFLAGRFSPDGTPSATYGDNGFTVTPVGTGHATVGGAVRLPDDSLLAAGSAVTTANVAALARWAGDDPQISVQPDLAFGDQQVGTLSAPREVTISNPGQAELRVTALNPTAEFEITDAERLDSVTLQPDQACTFGVAFRPAAPGARSGRLTVTSNAPGAAAGVDLFGSGTVAPPPPPPPGGPAPAPPELPAPATLTFSETLLDFGDELEGGQRSPEKPVEIINTGGRNLAITSIRPDDRAFVVTPGTCRDATVPSGRALRARGGLRTDDGRPPQRADRRGREHRRGELPGPRVRALAGARARRRDRPGPDAPGRAHRPRPARGARRADGDQGEREPRPPIARQEVPVEPRRAGSPRDHRRHGAKPGADAAPPGRHQRRPRRSSTRTGRCRWGSGKVEVDVEQLICPQGQAPGELRLGWLLLRTPECIRARTAGADFVVPVSAGGASLNGLDVQCPPGESGCELRIKRDEGGEPLAPGSSRPVTWRATRRCGCRSRTPPTAASTRAGTRSASNGANRRARSRATRPPRGRRRARVLHEVGARELVDPHLRQGVASDVFPVARGGRPSASLRVLRLSP